FGDGSTHTGSHLDPRNKDAAGNILFPLRHPPFMVSDKERDLEYFERYIEPSTLRRFKNRLKKVLPKEFDRAITPLLGRLQRKLGIN
ncbi:MAG: hypothetical protein WAU70_05455, partial [Flavobacteriales bacterium]